MKKLLWLFITIIYVNGGEILDVDKTFTTLCIEDHKKGYNFNNKKWKSIDSFKTEKYIIKKIRTNKKKCKEELLSKSSYYMERNACYTVDSFGNNYGFVRTCLESWTKNKNDKFHLSSIRCFDDGYNLLDINFQPTGNFVLNRMYTLPKNGDIKSDSISMSHGKCNQL